MSKARYLTDVISSGMTNSPSSEHGHSYVTF